MKYCIVIPTRGRNELLEKNWGEIARDHAHVFIIHPSNEVSPDGHYWNILLEDSSLQPNQRGGPALPRKIGVDWAIKLGYDVIFTADDDARLLTPELIPEMADTIYDLDIVLGAKQPFDFGAKDVIPEFIAQGGNMTAFWGFRADLIRRSGNFDPNFIMNDDHEFIWRARHYVPVRSWTKFKASHKHGQPGGLADDYYIDRATKSAAIWNAKYPGLVRVTANGKRLMFTKNYVYTPS